MTRFNANIIMDADSSVVSTVRKIDGKIAFVCVCIGPFSISMRTIKEEGLEDLRKLQDAVGKAIRLLSES